ncbi:hypothetical protein ACSBR2_008270 [Camellia fascicularis]
MYFGGREQIGLILNIDTQHNRERERERVMRIEVKCNCGGENKCKEWAIVELQGVIEPQPDFKDRLQNLPIGHLCRPSSQETYTLTVGYHELMGSKVPLKKPFLVLKKLRQSSSSSSKEQLEVVGIIRHRILFKTRPKALISRPQPFVKERVIATGSLVPN